MSMVGTSDLRVESPHDYWGEDFIHKLKQGPPNIKTATLASLFITYSFKGGEMTKSLLQSHLTADIILTEILYN